MTLNPKILIFSDFLAIFSCKRVNCDEMDRDRPRLLVNRNCYRLSRISWAWAQISCSNSKPSSYMDLSTRKTWGHTLMSPFHCTPDYYRCFYCMPWRLICVLHFAAFYVCYSVATEPFILQVWWLISWSWHSVLLTIFFQPCEGPSQVLENVQCCVAGLLIKSAKPQS